jgi:hypothetical protein
VKKLTIGLKVIFGSNPQQFVVPYNLIRMLSSEIETNVRIDAFNNKDEKNNDGMASSNEEENNNDGMASSLAKSCPVFANVKTERLTLHQYNYISEDKIAFIFDIDPENIIEFNNDSTEIWIRFVMGMSSTKLDEIERMLNKVNIACRMMNKDSPHDIIDFHPSLIIHDVVKFYQLMITKCLETSSANNNTSSRNFS